MVGGLWRAILLSKGLRYRVSDEELAAAIRAEGIPDSQRAYVADRLEGKHANPANRPSATGTERAQRDRRMLNLINSVTIEHARAKLAGTKSPQKVAYDTVAKGANMTSESLRLLVLTEKKRLRAEHQDVLLLSMATEERSKLLQTTRRVDRANASCTIEHDGRTIVHNLGLASKDKESVGQSP